MGDVRQQVAHHLVRVADLTGHGVKGLGQAAHLVVAAQVQLLIVVAPGHLLRSLGDPGQRSRDRARDEGGHHGRGEQRDAAGDGQLRNEVLPRRGDLRLRHHDQRSQAGRGQKAVLPLRRHHLRQLVIEERRRKGRVIEEVEPRLELRKIVRGEAQALLSRSEEQQLLTAAVVAHHSELGAARAGDGHPRPQEEIDGAPGKAGLSIDHDLTLLVHQEHAHIEAGGVTANDVLKLRPVQASALPQRHRQGDRLGEASHPLLRRFLLPIAQQEERAHRRDRQRENDDGGEGEQQARAKTS